MGNFLFWHCRWIRALFVLWTNLTFLVCWRRFSPYHFTLRIKPARERGDFQSFRHGDLQLLPPGSQDLGEEFLIYNFPKYWILTSSSGQHCILRIALLWAQNVVGFLLWNHVMHCHCSKNLLPSWGMLGKIEIIYLEWNTAVWKHSPSCLRSRAGSWEVDWMGSELYYRFISTILYI